MSTSTCGNPQKDADKDEGRESPGGGCKGEAMGGSAAALQERGGNWLHQETEALLELWGRPDVQSEMLTTIRNMDIYNRIAAQMQQRLPNCARSGLQCRYRIKRLKRAYLRSKNDAGHRRTFPFFAQMEAALAERAKVAEQKEKTEELSRKGGKKKKKKSKSREPSAAVAKGKGGGDAPGSSAAASLPASAEGAQIKIEIDNAEEYEHGTRDMDHAQVASTLRGGRVTRTSSAAAAAAPAAATVSATPESSGEEDDDDSGSSSSEEVKESVPGSTKKKSAGIDQRRSSLKGHRRNESESDSDTVPLVIATDLGQIEDLEQHSQLQGPVCHDMCSGGLAEAAAANSPPLCTIESVYRMKDSEALNGGPVGPDDSNNDEDPAAKLGRKEKSCENRGTSADLALGEQGNYKVNQECPQEPDTTNKTDNADTKSCTIETSECGEPEIRDTGVSKSKTKSKEPHESIQEHEISDLQIIAEWSVRRTSEADPLVDESVLIGEPPKKKKKRQLEASLGETSETPSPSATPQIVLAPNFTIVAPTSLASSTMVSGTGPHLPKQRTFVRVLEKPDKDKEPTNTTSSSGLGKSLLTKPGLSLLGSKSSPLPVTFQPTAARGASPRVIVYERPATSGSATTSSSVVSSSSPGSPLAAQGVRIIRVPHSSPALSSVSVGIGGKVIRVADSGSASPVTSTPVARTQVTSSSMESKQAPLTFTTLSSLDPVPRRFVLPREPLKVTYTSKTNPAKTTIVVPVTSASKQFTSKVVKSEGISETARPEPMRTLHIRPPLKRPNNDLKDETAAGGLDRKEASESETKVAVHLKDLVKTGTEGSELIPLIMSAKDYGRLASSAGVFLNAGKADRPIIAARSVPQHRGREIIITSTPNRSPGHQNSSLLASSDEFSPSQNKVRIIEVSSSSTNSKPVLITRGGTQLSEPPVTLDTASLSAPVIVQSKSSDNVMLGCGTVVTSFSNAQTESSTSSKAASTSGLNDVTESSKLLEGILAKLDKQVSVSPASSSTLLITRSPECSSSAISGDGVQAANSSDDPTSKKDSVEAVRNDDSHASPCLIEGGAVSGADGESTRKQVVVVNTSSLSSRQEDDLFRVMLSQTTLTAECQAWMLRTLHSRSATPATAPALSTSSTVAAEPAAVATVAGSHRASAGASEWPLTREGATVEVTNLVVGDEASRTEKQTGTFKVKAGLAQMAKGGIIMDVTTPEEARIAEEAGACAVMALERVPADIRRQGGVARMTDPKKIKDIIAAVTIPVMAKCRIGHFAEAQILEVLGVDMIDESEVLTPADEENHVEKHAFKVPFVCGARDLGEALRRISEGAAMIRTKGEAGTGDVVEAVRHARAIKRQIKVAQSLDPTELYSYAKELRVPYELLKKTAELGRLPVVNFAAGGLATPADVSLLMQLGVDGVFVGSGIFKSAEPPARARAMAQAVTHYRDPQKLAALSEGLGEAMFGTPVHPTGGSSSSSSSHQRRDSSATSGRGGDGEQQDKLWNATLALDKFRLSA